MSVPRKHHYVSRFYLEGFASDETQAGQLSVLDKQTGRQWRSSPSDTACEKDFYMLEVDEDEDALAIEELFGRVETKGSAALRHVIEHLDVPDGEMFEDLMDFLAIMTVRGPGVIDSIQKPFVQVMKSIMWQMTASKERWEQQSERLRAEGEECDDITWEQMREFVCSDNYEIAMSQNFKMSSLLAMLELAVPLLSARKWSVVSTPEVGPHFICSDRPVAVCWFHPDQMGQYPPGLGLKRTSVAFPVNKRIGLLGIFETQLPKQELTGQGVGIANMWTGLYAKRFVYSTHDDFTVTLRDKTIGGKEEFMSAVSGSRRKS